MPFGHWDSSDVVAVVAAAARGLWHSAAAWDATDAVAVFDDAQRRYCRVGRDLIQDWRNPG